MTRIIYPCEATAKMAMIITFSLFAAGLIDMVFQLSRLAYASTFAFFGVVGTLSNWGKFEMIEESGKRGM